tara:strand:- start:39117 stop:39320 length:204 start_codon:yes stop_codon:yes gene_type:complete
MNTTTSPLYIRDLKAGDHVAGIGTVNNIEAIDDDRFRVAWSYRGRIVAATWDRLFPVAELASTMGEG